MQKGAVLLCCKLTPKGAAPVPPGHLAPARGVTWSLWTPKALDTQGTEGQGTALPQGSVAQPFLALCCWLHPQPNNQTPEINPCVQAPWITEQPYS